MLEDHEIQGLLMNVLLLKAAVIAPSAWRAEVKLLTYLLMTFLNEFTRLDAEQIILQPGTLWPWRGWLVARTIPKASMAS
jgi:hypothetical protein